MDKDKKSFKVVLDNLSETKVVSKNSKVKVVSVESIVEALQNITKKPIAHTNIIDDVEEALLEKSKEIEEKKLELIQGWQKKILEKQQRIDTLEVTCKTLKEIIAEKDLCIQDLTASEVRLKAEEVTLKRKILDIEGSSELLEKQIEQKQRVVHAMEDEIEDKKSLMVNMEARLTTLEKSLEEKDREVSELKIELEENKEEKESLTQEMQKKHEELLDKLEHEKKRVKELLNKDGRSLFGDIDPEDMDKKLHFVRSLILGYYKVLTNTCEEIISGLGGARHQLNKKEKEIEDIVKKNLLELENFDESLKKIPECLIGIEQLIDIFHILSEMQEIGITLSNLIESEKLTRNYGPIYFST